MFSQRFGTTHLQSRPMPAENKPSKRICTYRIQKFSMRLKDEPIDVTLPTSSNAPVLTPEDEAAHSKARSDAVKVRCRTAWSLNRWPLDFQRRIMSARTRVHLPREFKGVGGQDVKVIYEGQELNGFIHEWYSVAEGSEDKGNEQEAKDEAKRKRRNKVNYVTADGISARRYVDHRYLSPAPQSSTLC